MSLSTLSYSGVFSWGFGGSDNDAKDVIISDFCMSICFPVCPRLFPSSPSVKQCIDYGFLLSKTTFGQQQYRAEFLFSPTIHDLKLDKSIQKYHHMLHSIVTIQISLPSFVVPDKLLTDWPRITDRTFRLLHRSKKKGDHYIAISLSHVSFSLGRYVAKPSPKVVYAYRLIILSRQCSRVPRANY